MIGDLISAGSKLIGGFLQGKETDKNIKLQKQFAKKGIQWKVADSLKAGIHPLYGLGAQTHSFAPVAVGGGLGGAIADMGQDIGRAIDVGGSTEDRVLRKLQLERAGLENELLKSQIATQRSAQIGPGMPVVSGSTGIADVRIPGFGTVKGDPNLSKAQALQDEYGEIIEGIGAVNFFNQILKQFPESNPGNWPGSIKKWWNDRSAIGRSRINSWR